MSQQQPEPPQPLPAYYQNLDSAVIEEAFRDFDSPLNLEYFNQAITSYKSRNFVVDFGDSAAWSAFDLDADSYSRLILAKRPNTLNTRWINLWFPHDQKDVVNLLAKYYDFTPRLLGMMCSKPIKKRARSVRDSASAYAYASASSSSAASTTNRPASLKSYFTRRTESQTWAESFDVEKQIGLADAVPSYNVDITRTLNQYAMASDLWHFSTMDWGRRFVCLGYNTLHVIEEEEQTEEEVDLPNCKRLWTWLVLCEDKTVITIHEDPYPFTNSALSLREQRNLNIMRRNLSNVFRQCSKSLDPLQGGERIVTPLALPLRIRVGDSEKETIHRASDVPGLLFYYLFDDWLAIYTLIARRDNLFAEELNALRRQMLSKPALRHVDRLHHLACQLAILKRIYQGYNLLVDRLLGRREISLASLQNSHYLNTEAYTDQQPFEQLTSNSQSQPHHMMMGVSISSAAKVRFERLQHRLQLYALNEVNDCLDQKDSLIQVNFNLLAIKQSVSMEKFTEITLLLGKVTLLFLPVSLLTSYFSCQFYDYQFSNHAYWKWFGGILAISVVLLAVFSLMSTVGEGRLWTWKFSKRGKKSEMSSSGDGSGSSVNFAKQ